MDLANKSFYYNCEYETLYSSPRGQYPLFESDYNHHDECGNGKKLLKPSPAAKSSTLPYQRNWTTTYRENPFSTKHVHETHPVSQVVTNWGEMESRLESDSEPGTSNVRPGNRNLTDCDTQEEVPKIGICGWRKNCFYFLLLALLIIIAFNFIVTLWFIGSMRINSDGIGKMKIFEGGVMLNGAAYFMDNLITSRIESKSEKPISIVASDKFSVSIRDPQGLEISQFLITNDSVQFITKVLNVKNEKGQVMFSVDKQSVIYNSAKEIKITGKRGAIVNEGIETPLVKGHFKDDLNLVSIHKKVDLVGSSGVLLTAYAGDVIMSALTGVKIKAEDGTVRIDTRKIFMPSLPIAAKIDSTVDERGLPIEKSIPLDHSKYFERKSGSATKHVKFQSVYQVCVCGNGKLFFSPSNAECAVDRDSSICR